MIFGHTSFHPDDHLGEIRKVDPKDLQKIINPNLGKPSPLNTQVGGNHYKTKGIQPVVYILENNLGFCEGNAIKYLTRWKDKNGVEDLRKARHYIDILIEQQTKTP